MAKEEAYSCGSASRQWAKIFEAGGRSPASLDVFRWRRRKQHTSEKKAEDYRKRAFKNSQYSSICSFQSSRSRHEPCTFRHSNPLLQGRSGRSPSTHSDMSRKIMGYVGGRKNDSIVRRSVNAVIIVRSDSKNFSKALMLQIS